MTSSTDLRLVRRAGRLVAVQISLALTAVLVLVGGLVVIVYARAQNDQIDGELTTVAQTADDAIDPPPGMELAIRDNDGEVFTSDGGAPGVPLLSGPAGFVDLASGGRNYRALAVDRPEGRVVALADLAPYRASRLRLLAALAIAEFAGILVSIGVIVLFTRRAVRPLTEALALQRRFVADASHELRAPLTVLHTRAQLLASRLDSGDLPAARQDAHAMVADTRAMSGVVDDLLSSATVATVLTDSQRVDVSAVARSVCDSMAPYADSLGVRLKCTGAGGADVMGSESALRRAFTALVDNALGHEQPGGSVAVAVRRDGEQVIIAVADDGTGIDPAVAARLFERFSRGSDAARRSHGIGLSLVREIVVAHGGDIRVASEPGRGSTFTVALPAAAPG